MSAIKSAFWYAFGASVIVLGLVGLADVVDHDAKIVAVDYSKNFVVKDVRQEGDRHFVVLEGTQTKKTVTFERNRSWGVKPGDLVGAGWNVFLREYCLTQPVKYDSDDDFDDWFMYSVTMS